MLAPTTAFTLLAAAIVILLVIATPFSVRQRRYSARICGRWGLDPATTRVISSDLASHRSNKALLAEGLAANPDVLFRDNRNRQIIVGEAKSRHYKGSRPPTITPSTRSSPRH